MGYSPLSGLMMGTRPGDLDPGVILTMAQQLQMSWPEIDSLLNRSAGLKGICGTNDMRSIIHRRAQGDANAELALAMYVHRIQRYTGALLAVSGPIDALVFTAGVGENSSLVRQLICQGLGHLGIKTDPVRNEAGQTEISPDGATTKVLVIPTNEELEICRQSNALLSQLS
jgi:acetate kinase